MNDNTENENDETEAQDETAGGLLSKLEAEAAHTTDGGDTLNAEELAAKSNIEEANKTLDEARVGLTDSLEGTLKAGRAFNKLKLMFKKGTWLPRLKMEAKRSGHSVRSIQEYMKAAKEADAKNAKVRVFAKAEDKEAVDIRAASDEAAQKVADAVTAADLLDSRIVAVPPKPPRKSPPLLDGRFLLPLYLTGDEKEASKKMLESQNWPGVQKDMTATWLRLLTQYGFLPAESTTAPKQTSGYVPGYVATHDDVPDIFPKTEAADDDAHPSA